MEIEILGTESLGVRGLSCWVRTANRRILIDPGVALGYQRQGLLPHPIQVAAGEEVRRELYERFPVPAEWHDQYARGTATTETFRDEAS